jgi:hypothetical protein
MNCIKKGVLPRGSTDWTQKSAMSLAFSSQEDSIIGEEVEEYLQTMEDNTGASSKFSRPSDDDNLLLWPETLYPDMYGKTLNGLQTSRLLDAEEFSFSTACVSSCAASMYTSLLAPSC